MESNINVQTHRPTAESEELLDTLVKYRKLVETAAVPDEFLLLWLVHCISTPNVDQLVIETALETISRLIQYGHVRELKKTLGLGEAINTVLFRNDLPANVTTLAGDVHKRLEDGCCECRKTRSLKRISLHVQGLSNDTRQKLELAALRVKGVVSVVCDVIHQQCVLWARQAVEPVDIAVAIFDLTEMEAKLITKNSQGQEIFKPLLEIVDTLDCSQDDWPSFFDKDSPSPVKESAVCSAFSIRDKTTSLFSSARKFLQDSFYW